MEKELAMFLEKNFSKELEAIKNQEEFYEWRTACEIICAVMNMTASYIYELSDMYIDETDIFDYWRQGAW